MEETSAKRRRTDTTTHSFDELDLCDTCNLRTVRRLVAKGANIDIQARDGRTTLHRAVYNKRGPTVAFLLAKGANVDIQDNEGNTALHLAATKKHTKFVKLLLEKNAQVGLKNDAGETPLILAASRSASVTKLLLANGANPRQCDAAHKSAAVIACTAGMFGVLRALIDAGACVDDCDTNENSLLDIALDAHVYQSFNC